jgi:hypothetical protein
MHTRKLSYNKNKKQTPWLESAGGNYTDRLVKLSYTQNSPCTFKGVSLNYDSYLKLPTYKIKLHSTNYNKTLEICNCL